MALKLLLLLVGCAACAENVRLAWDPSPTPDVLYRVSWGPSDNPIVNSTNVGKALQATINVPTNVLTYARVYAVSQDGAVSFPSNQIFIQTGKRPYLHISAREELPDGTFVRTQFLGSLPATAGRAYYRTVQMDEVVWLEALTSQGAPWTMLLRWSEPAPLRRTLIIERK